MGEGYGNGEVWALQWTCYPATIQLLPGLFACTGTKSEIDKICKSERQRSNQGYEHNLFVRTWEDTTPMLLDC